MTVTGEAEWILEEVLVRSRGTCLLAGWWWEVLGTKHGSLKPDEEARFVGASVEVELMPDIRPLKRIRRDGLLLTE